MERWTLIMQLILNKFKHKHNHEREMEFEIRSHVAALPISRSCHCIMSSLSTAVVGDRGLSGQGARSVHKSKRR
jgi:hypothetical protein